MAAKRVDKKAWAKTVVRKLAKLYPDAECALDHALVRPRADPRVEGDLAARITAAEVERVGPLLLGPRRVESLVELGDAGVGHRGAPYPRPRALAMIAP